MPIPIIGAGIAAARAAAAAKLATRIAGGIKNSKTVGKDFAEGEAPPISNRTPSIEESKAKIRKDLGIPERGTPAYERYSAKSAAREKTSRMRSRIRGD